MRSTARRFLFALLTALSASSAAAQVFPAYLNYQGKLGDPTGSPLTGTYSFRFRLYDQASGGNLLFTDANYTGGNAVSVVNGVYSVQIGSLTAGGIPPSVFFNSEVWLEIDVSPGANFTGAETLTPRERLATSPFAFRAAYAEHLGAGGVAVATFTTGGVLLLPYGVTAATASFTNTSGFSLAASSGINVAAGGVYAPFFSGTYYGDGSHLSGIAPGESNTYASSKTFTSDVLIAGPAKLAASSATFTYGVTAATFTASSSMTASAFFGDGAGITFGAPSGGIYSRFNANGSLSMAQDRGITLTGCSGGGVALGGGGAVVDCNGLHLPNGAFNNTNTIDNSGSGAGTAGSHLVVSAGAGNGSGESGGRIYLGGQDSSGQNASVQINAPGANGVIALANTSDPRISWSGTQKVGIGTAGPANKLSVAGNADVSGLFGVGTTAPATTLEVAGSASFGSGAAKSTFTAVGGLFLASGSSATLSGANGFITSASSVTASAFFGDGSHLSGIPTAAGIAAAYVAKAGDTMTGQLTLSGSTLTVGGNAFSVGASTFVVVGGNVGIGTNNPTAAKTVISIGGGTANAPLALIDSDGGGGQVNFNLFSGSLSNAANGDALVSNTIGNLLLSPNAASKDIKLIGGAWTNPVSMIVKDGGNVGIGTANPATKLHMSSGTLTVDGTTPGLTVGVSTFVVAGGAVGIGDVPTAAYSNTRLYVSAPASQYAAEISGNGTNSQSYGLMVTGGTTASDVAMRVANALNNTEFMRIRGDGNVGIGAANPTNTLHIQKNGFSVQFDSGSATGQDIGNITYGVAASDSFDIYGRAGHSLGLGTNGTTQITVGLTGNTAIGTASTGAKLDVGGSPSGNWGLRVAGNSTAGSSYGVGIYAGTNSSDDAMRIHNTSNAILFDVRGDGNVGVGTASPASKLTVVGDVRIAAGSGGALYFADGTSMSSAGSGSASAISNATDAIMTGDSDANGSGDVILKTGSNDRLHILNGGNVGIGTTHPATKLHLSSGTILADGTNAFIQVSADRGFESLDPAGGNLWNFGSNVGNFIFNENNGGNWVTIQKGTGYVGIGTTNPAAALHVSSASSTGSTVIMEVSSGTAAGQQLMVVQANGNVGIGTASPTTKLHVASSVMRLGDVNGGQLRFYDGSSDLGVVDMDNAGRMDLYVGGATAGNLKMSVTSSGSVGIGTTNPATKFQLSSGVVTVDGTNPGLTVGVSTLVVTGGQVGIGTASPNYKLQVVGNTGNSIATEVGDAGTTSAIYHQYINGGGSYYIGVDRSAGGNLLTGSLPYSLNLYAPATRAIQLGVASPALTIDQNNKVGIGTANPATKLHMSSGTLLVDGTNAAVTVAGGSVTASAFFGDGSHLSGVGGGLSGGIANVVPVWTGASSLGTSVGSSYLTSYSTGVNVQASTFSVGGSTFVVTGGKVGIGTGGPQWDMEVHTDDRIAITAISANKGAYINYRGTESNGVSDGPVVAFAGVDNSAGTNLFNIAASPYSFDIVAPVARKIHMGDSWGIYLTVDAATGNVGISTATPALPLDVAGAAQFGQGATKSTFTASGGLFIASGSSLTLSGANGFIVSASSISASAFFGDGSHLTGLLSTAAANAAYVAKTGDTMTGQLTLSGSTLTVTGTDFSVGGTTFVVTGGSLGVGTAAPGTIFEVVSPLSSGKGIRVSRGGTPSQYVQIGENATNSHSITVTNSKPLDFTTDMLAGAGSAFQFATGNGTFLTMSGTGYISINRNTINAATLLHMSSGVFTLDGTGPGININPGATASTTNPFTVGASTFVILGSNGNIGVGTNAPYQKFHIQVGANGNTSTSDEQLIVERSGGHTGINIIGPSGYNDHILFSNASTRALGSISYDISAQDMNFYNGGSPRFTLKSGGNAGVGTSNPAARLHVSTGGAIFDGTSPSLTVVGGSVTASAFFGDGSHLTGLLSTAAANAAYVAKAGDTMTGQLTLSGSTLTVTGNAFSVGGSTLVASGGSVGIGTAAPAKTLHIQGLAADYSTLLQGGSGRTTAAYTGILLRSSDTAATAMEGNFLLYGDPTASNRRISIYSYDVAGAAYGNVVFPGGNVGIGNTNPASKLTVTGDIRIAAGSGGVLYFADGTSMSSSGSGSASAISNATDAIMTGDSDANGSGDVILKTGSNDRLHILNSNGYVGIGGQTNPQQPLHILGTNKHVMRLDTGGGTTQTYIEFINNTKTWQLGNSDAFGNYMDWGLRNATDNTNPLNVTIGGSVGIGVPAPSATLHVSSAGATGTTLLMEVSSGTGAGQQLMVVQANGNMGIGTASPSTRLHAYINDSNSVVATIENGAVNNVRALALKYPTPAVPATLGGLSFDTGAGSIGHILGNVETVGPTAGGVSIYTGNAGGVVEQMRIDRNGNVGIGSIGPASRLHVSSGVVTVDGTNPGLSVGVSTFVVTGGNVGIGTASPAMKLHLYTTSGNNAESIQNTNASGFTALQLYSDVDQSYLLYGGSSYSGYAGAKALNLIAGGGPIAFFNTATEAMRITTGGNVGIGTPNPAGKLHVSSSTLFVDGTGAAVNVAGGSVTASAFFGDGSHLSGVASASNFVAKAGDTMTGQLTLSGSTLTVIGNAFSVGVTTLAVNGGNVGFGTVNPAAKIDVRGGGAIVSATTAGLPDPFGYNASNAGLHVYSQNTFGITNNIYGAGAGNPNWAGGIGFSRSNGATGAETALQSGDTIAIIQFIGSTGASAWATGARIEASPDANWSGASSPTSLIFKTTPSGATSLTEKMRITNAGNVGISTAIPVLPLDVNGAAQFGSGATRSTFTALGGLFIASGSSLTLSGANGFATSASSITASAFFGDGSHLTGLLSTAAANAAYVAKAGDTMTGGLVVTGPQSATTTELLRLTKVSFGGTIFNQYYDNNTAAYGLQIVGTEGRASLVTDTSVSPARVGIGGVLLPQTNLDVAGNAQFGSGATKSTFTATGDLNLASGAKIALLGSAGYLTAQSSVAASAFFGDGSHLSGILSTASANAAYVAKAGDTMTGQLTLSGSTLTVTGSAFSVSSPTFVITGGNVGIGTANPARTLHLNSGSGVSSALQFEINAANTGLIGVDKGSNIMSAAAAGDMVIRSANNLVFGTNGDNVRMYLAGGGNVGVGTTAPATLFDVNGAAQFGAGAFKSTFTATGGLTVPYGVTAGSVTLNNAITNAQVGVFNCGDTADCLDLLRSGGGGLQFGTDGGNNTQIKSVNRGMHFYQDSFGYATQKNRSFLFEQNGGAGIVVLAVKGFASQTADLQEWQSNSDVSVASVTADGSFVNKSSVAASAFFGDGSHLSGIPTAAGIASSYVAKAGDTMTGQLTLSGSTLTVTGNAFSIGSSTLTASGGNVGIGTANPAAKLHLSSGTLSMDGTAATLRLRASDSSLLSVSQGASQSGNIFQVTDSGGSTPIFGANVNGIGFAVTMNIGAGAATNNVGVTNIYSNSSNGAIDINDSGGAQKVGFRAVGSSYFNGGSVGIGTANPATKLHLSSGVMTLDGTGAGLTLTNTAVMTANSTATFNSQANFANVASTQAVFAGLSAAGGASPNSGTILLGSASAGARLDVNGPGGTLYVDNMLDQTNTQIDFRLRTANASPDTVLFLGGSSGLSPVGKSGGNGATSIMADGRLYVGGNGVATSSLSVVGGVVTMPSGPVGIGTANPAAKLHMSSGTLLVDGTAPAINVAGGSVTASAFFGDGSHLAGILSTASANAAYVAKTGDSMSGQLTIAGSSLTVISNAASSPLVVSTTTNLGTGNAALYVDGTNNVGVWTTHPAAGLTIGDSWTNSGTYPYPNLFLAGNSGSIAKALITGKWQSTNLWGIGPFSTGADNTIRLGNVDSATGTWSTSQNINLMIGGLNNENNLGMLDVSGTNPTVIVHDYNSGNGNAYFRLGKDYNDWKGGFVDYDGVNNLLNIGVHNTADTTLANDLNAITVVRSNGNVGIGTGLTAAAATLHVSSAATSGTTLLIEASSGTASGQQVMVLQANGSMGLGTTSPTAQLHISSAGNLNAMNNLILVTTGATPTNLFRVQANGNVYALGSFNGGGADVAEMYPASAGIEAGDVVAFGPDGKLVRFGESRGAVLGIVSTRPGTVLGWDVSKSEMPDQRPVALTGRVPVKATLENGPIRRGDALSAASRPGYAKKARDGEATIGLALEDFDALRGTVMCFVRIGENAAGELKSLRRENEDLRRQIDELREIVRARRK